jgi:protein pelota
VYNLVRTGDLVTATTFRKIQRESGAGQESEKVKLKLSIRVEAIDFDPEGSAPCITADFDIGSSLRQCSSEVRCHDGKVPVFAGQEIRLSGKNLTENEYVKLGAHHTLQLEPHRTLQLSKAAWDGLDLARIREACDPSVSADLAVVLITASACRQCAGHPDGRHGSAPRRQTSAP